MMMLYKRNGKKTEYWGAWKTGRSLTIHTGTVGTAGTKEELPLGLFQSAPRLISRLANEQVRIGFEHIEEDDLRELVVQFPYEEHNEQDAVDQSEVIEEALDDCLSQNGIGYLDGGDFGGGKANIYFCVIDVDLAFRAVSEELARRGLLDEAAIACGTPGFDDHSSLHPAGAEFRLMDSEDE
ncbi:hypothetical protein ACFFIY_13230 [Bhargavaea ullalensis]|uniref:Uncharacterized protein n=1 Tax=Bhargavaea ullalensis TaxID=1265685 RepID=A0ABV2G828_9BACL